MSFSDLLTRIHAINPLLHGFATAQSEVSTIDFVDLDVNKIALLYSHIQNQHPEAKTSYWQSRLWTLLCWQPIQVSLTSIYAAQLLPMLTSMQQICRPTSIFGFYFEHMDLQHGSQHELIDGACQDLRSYFGRCRQVLSEFVPISKQRMHYVTADMLTLYWLDVFQAIRFCPISHVSTEISRWLVALELPVSVLQNLTLAMQHKSCFYRRSSCCFTYQLNQGKMCANCPKNRLQASSSCLLSQKN